MKKYNFWGFEHADVHAVNDEYKGIDTPYDLYDALSERYGVPRPVHRE